MKISFIKENHFNNCIEAIHGVQNYNKSEAKHIVAEAKVNNDTQFYRIKGGGGGGGGGGVKSCIGYSSV